MSSKHLRGDVNYAWPSAEIAVMGAKGAVEIIFRADIGDPKRSPRARRNIPIASPTPSWRRASVIVDDVIMPRETRKRIIRALAR
jgi:propionyl-CoA carboxylase beta chain